MVNVWKYTKFHHICIKEYYNFVYLFLNTALVRVIINAAVGTLERSELEEFVSKVAYKLNKPRATNPKGNNKKRSRGPRINDGNRY